MLVICLIVGYVTKCSFNFTEMTAVMLFSVSWLLPVLRACRPSSTNSRP